MIEIHSKIFDYYIEVVPVLAQCESPLASPSSDAFDEDASVDSADTEPVIAAPAMVAQQLPNNNLYKATDGGRDEANLAEIFDLIRLVNSSRPLGFGYVNNCQSVTGLVNGDPLLLSNDLSSTLPSFGGSVAIDDIRARKRRFSSNSSSLPVSTSGLTQCLNSLEDPFASMPLRAAAIPLLLRAAVRPMKRVGTECPVCQFRTEDSKKMQDHLLHHGRSFKPGVYVCVVCTYETPHTHHFKRHMLQHSGYFPYKCKGCDFKARRLENLKRHTEKNDKCRLTCEFGRRRKRTDLLGSMPKPKVTAGPVLDCLHRSQATTANLHSSNEQLPGASLGSLTGLGPHDSGVDGGRLATSAAARSSLINVSIFAHRGHELNDQTTFCGSEDAEDDESTGPESISESSVSPSFELILKPECDNNHNQNGLETSPCPVLRPVVTKNSTTPNQMEPNTPFAHKNCQQIHKEGDVVQGYLDGNSLDWIGNIVSPFKLNGLCFPSATQEVDSIINSSQGFNSSGPVLGTTNLPPYRFSGNGFGSCSSLAKCMPRSTVLSTASVPSYRPGGESASVPALTSDLLFAINANARTPESSMSFMTDIKLENIIPELTSLGEIL